MKRLLQRTTVGVALALAGAACGDEPGALADQLSHAARSVPPHAGELRVAARVLPVAATVDWSAAPTAVRWCDIRYVYDFPRLAVTWREADTVGALAEAPAVRYVWDGGGWYEIRTDQQTILIHARPRLPLADDCLWLFMGVPGETPLGSLGGSMKSLRQSRFVSDEDHDGRRRVRLVVNDQEDAELTVAPTAHGLAIRALSQSIRPAPDEPPTTWLDYRTAEWTRWNELGVDAPRSAVRRVSMRQRLGDDVACAANDVAFERLTLTPLSDDAVPDDPLALAAPGWLVVDQRSGLEWRVGAPRAGVDGAPIAVDATAPDRLLAPRPDATSSHDNRPDRWVIATLGAAALVIAGVLILRRGA